MVWKTLDCPYCRKVIEVEIELRCMPSNDIMDQSPADVCELTVRAENALRESGISTMRQLVSLYEVDLLRLPNFGRVSLKVVNEELAKKGLHLGMALDGP